MTDTRTSTTRPACDGRPGLSKKPYRAPRLVHLDAGGTCASTSVGLDAFLSASFVPVS